MSRNPKKPNRWLALVSMPVQMGAIVFLLAWLGRWLDGKYPNPHGVYVKILTLLGVMVAFYNLNRQLKDLNKSE